MKLPAPNPMLLGAVLALLASCVNTGRPGVRAAQIETIPSGARCVTTDGQVYVTPATIPCPRSGLLRLDVELDGHTSRRVEVCTRKPDPRFEGFLVGLPLLFSGERWELVEAHDGRAILELIPLEASFQVQRTTESTPGASIPTSLTAPKSR